MYGQCTHTVKESWSSALLFKGSFTTYSLCILCWLQFGPKYLFPLILTIESVSFLLLIQDHTIPYLSFLIWALNSTGLSTMYFGCWFSSLESPSYSALTNWPTDAVPLQSPYKQLQGYLLRPWEQVQIWEGARMSQGSLVTTHFRTTQIKAVPDNQHMCQKTHWQDSVDEAYNILEFHWFSLLLHTRLPSSQRRQSWRWHGSVPGCRYNQCLGPAYPKRPFSSYHMAAAYLGLTHKRGQNTQMHSFFCCRL